MQKFPHYSEKSLALKILLDKDIKMVVAKSKTLLQVDLETLVFIFT